ncbi:MAG: transglycosylase domain-containing protein [Cytophagaceae bacterium]
MSERNPTLKFFVWAILIFALAGVLFAAGFIYYLETSIDQVMSRKRQTEIIAMINTSPDLPESFYKTYNKYYPGALDRSVWRSVVNQLLGRRKSISCPCRNLYLTFYADQNNSPRLSALIIALEIEEHCSRKKCFDFMMSEAYFGSNTRGVSAASQFYYKKTIEQLSEKEILELCIIEKGPSFYNPRYNKDRLDQAVDALMNKKR